MRSDAAPPPQPRAHPAHCTSMTTIPNPTETAPPAYPDPQDMGRTTIFEPTDSTEEEE